MLRQSSNINVVILSFLDYVFLYNRHLSTALACMVQDESSVWECVGAHNINNHIHNRGGSANRDAFKP